MKIMIDELKNKLEIREHELMSGHTTFRVGGPADIMALPQSLEELKTAIAYARQEKIPYYVMGNGSNLLVGDKGYRGMIIKFLGNFNDLHLETDPWGGIITAQSGALLGRAAALAAENSLSGMEELSGIPGTLGGACVMNAGAYGRELKDVLISAHVLTPKGEVLELSTDELKLGYRTSIIPEKGYIVLDARLGLIKGDPVEIRNKMEDFKCRRLSKQPLDRPSAGSTFKRPEGYFAGALIEQAGLKGFSLGGVSVSDKHCGFVVTNGHATAAEIHQLIDHVIQTVREKSGITLKPEVRFLGE